MFLPIYLEKHPENYVLILLLIASTGFKELDKPFVITSCVHSDCTLSHLLVHWLMSRGDMHSLPGSTRSCSLNERPLNIHMLCKRNRHVASPNNVPRFILMLHLNQLALANNLA